MDPAASDLGSPNEDERRFAIIDASVAADASKLPQLLALLREDTYANRRHIARAIGNIGGSEAVSALLQLLAKEEGLILGDVARSLGRLKVVEAAHLLRGLLDHQLDWVRSGARESLRRLDAGTP